MTKQIQGKPTTYHGVRFRSRLEARWAVFLDYYILADQWIYEPRNFTLPKEGWGYTPDFFFKTGTAQGFLEVKPVMPEESYLHVLSRFASVLPVELFLGIGDFYRGHPQVCTVSPKALTPKKLGAILVALTSFFPRSGPAALIASRARLDLPFDPPRFRGPGRMGSKSPSDYVREWAERERAKTRNRKGKRK